MAQDKFGSPNLGDPTAEIEEDIEYAAQETARIIRDDGPRVQNRPVGSVSTPPAARVKDWLQQRHDPNFWMSQFIPLARVKGPVKAAKELLEYDRDMRKRIARYGPTTT